MCLASQKSVGVIIDNQQICTEEILHDIRNFIYLHELSNHRIVPVGLPCRFTLPTIS